MSTINFYHKTDPYYEFTNFYERKPIEIDGVKWKTSEHYFQAQKFKGYPELIESVRLLPSPRDAFAFVRRPDVQDKIRQDWPLVKENVMLHALRCKFSQSRRLKSLLLSTGDAVLVEHTANDNYWGDGGDGSGKNRLGNLLMKVREELKNL